MKCLTCVAYDKEYTRQGLVEYKDRNLFELSPAERLKFALKYGGLVLLALVMFSFAFALARDIGIVDVNIPMRLNANGFGDWRDYFTYMRIPFLTEHHVFFILLFLVVSVFVAFVPVGKKSANFTSRIFERAICLTLILIFGIAAAAFTRWVPVYPYGVNRTLVEIARVDTSALPDMIQIWGFFPGGHRAFDPWQGWDVSRANSSLLGVHFGDLFILRSTTILIILFFLIAVTTIFLGTRIARKLGRSYEAIISFTDTDSRRINSYVSIVPSGIKGTCLYGISFNLRYDCIARLSAPSKESIHITTKGGRTYLVRNYYADSMVCKLNKKLTSN